MGFTFMDIAVILIVIVGIVIANILKGCIEKNYIDFDEDEPLISRKEIQQISLDSEIKAYAKQAEERVRKKDEEMRLQKLKDKISEIAEVKNVSLNLLLETLCITKGVRRICGFYDSELIYKVVLKNGEQSLCVIYKDMIFLEPIDNTLLRKMAKINIGGQKNA